MPCNSLLKWQWWGSVDRDRAAFYQKSPITALMVHVNTMHGLNFFGGEREVMPSGFEGEERDAVAYAVAAMQKYKSAFRVDIVLGPV